MSFFLTPPKDFNPKVEAAGIHCEFGDRFLLVKRSPGKDEGNTWCIPGGKLEKGETAQDAVLRELYEETGLSLTTLGLFYIGQLFVRKPHIDFIFHMFHFSMQSLPKDILLNKENEEFRWVTLEETKVLPLIIGGKECLDFIYREKPKNGHKE